jgi:hypothetical protein
MLKVAVQLFFRKGSQKLCPSGFVYFANAVYQFPFAHTYVPVSFEVPGFVLVPTSSCRKTRVGTAGNIDKADVFSLAAKAEGNTRPYNANHYITGWL